jgi:hypothetical protein
MLYGYIAVSHYQPVPDHVLLTLNTASTALGFPLGPPASTPATPSSTR